MGVVVDIDVVVVPVVVAGELALVVAAVVAVVVVEPKMRSFFLVLDSFIDLWVGY